MQIQIIAVSKETKPTAKGSYVQAEIVFKNLTYGGKTEAKKLMDFEKFGVFPIVANAPPGSVFDIEVVKNDKGFNDWTKATPGTAGAPVAQAPASAIAGYNGSTSNSNAKAPSAPTRSTYETPEERAAKQVYIVRQSSVSAAINTLSIGAKSAPKSADVVALAREYEAYVFDKGAVGETSVDLDTPDFDDVPM